MSGPHTHDDLTPTEYKLKLKRLELAHEKAMAELALKKSEGWRAFLKPLVAAMCGLIGIVGAYWLGGARTTLDREVQPVEMSYALSPPSPVPYDVWDSGLGLHIDAAPEAGPEEPANITVDTGSDASVGEQLLRLLPDMHGTEE